MNEFPEHMPPNAEWQRMGELTEFSCNNVYLSSMYINLYLSILVFTVC